MAQNIAAQSAFWGIKPHSPCCELATIMTSTGRDRTMTKTMFATLAFAATIALSGSAFAADKYKATLDGKSEVPANSSAGKGTADIDYDAATKKMTWKLTYSGLSGPATAAHFHGPAEAGKNAGVEV